jgi:hypothetical protein
MKVTCKAYTRSDGVKVKATTYKVASEKDKKWYNPRVHTGWRKGDPATTRRRRAIIAHGSNRLAAARALQALANVSVDPATKRLAALDARYIFAMYKKYSNG